MNTEPFVFDFGMKWYQLQDWKEVVSKAKSSNQDVFCWKSIGIENWLEKRLSICDVLCLVMLPKGLPDYIDLPDDEFKDD